MINIDNTQVRVGDETVTIITEGRSKPIVANILDKISDSEGNIRKIWLDRLVHAPGETQFGEWMLEGAISSILSKPHGIPH